MKDPVRLLEGEDALAARVLESAREDGAPRHLRGQVSAALGLGAIAAAGTTSGTAAALGTAAKGGGLLASVGIAKLATALVVVGIAAAGMATYVASGSSGSSGSSGPSGPSGPRQSGATTPAAVSRASRGSAGGEVANVAPTAPSPTLTAATPIPTAAAASALTSPANTSAISTTGPTARAATTTSPPSDPVSIRPSVSRIPTGAPRVAASASPVVAPAGLVQELVPLDAARAAFDSGDGPLALRELDRHDLDYPHGQLAPEALALRIEVYARRHDDSKVIELTDAFLARYPDHPQTARVRAFAAGARH